MVLVVVLVLNGVVVMVVNSVMVMVGGVFICCSVSSYLTVDHVSLSRRSSTLPTPTRDTSNSWALITLSPYIA